jgi:uncharacterized protein YecE (DUF72 family)
VDRGGIAVDQRNSRGEQALRARARAVLRELLAGHGASLAIGDDKRRPLPEAAPVGPLAYLRLHYGHRGRGGNYSEAELDVWRRRIAAWRARRPVFVYLNNDWNGYAPANARFLRQGLATSA